MKILGIESSCDDTSVALLDITDTHINILAEKTASQIDIHKKYGGVVPEVAGRAHAEQIIPVIEEVLKDHPKPDVIAVTSGPGLITGLVVGVEVAKTLSMLWNVPLIGVNHIEGHIHSIKLNEIPKHRKPELPALCAIVSGGHTALILMKAEGVYELIGTTRDDAAGEAFDKAAKMLGLLYPGGPKISKHGAMGNPKAIAFPRPMMNSDNYDFSFSGLKTAALYWLQDNATEKDGTFSIKSDAELNDFCASYEQAIIDVLVKKSLKAAKEYKARSFILAGGVSANKKLREALTTSMKDIPVYLSPLSHAMDNAAMIAVAAYHQAKAGEVTPWNEVEANPNWRVWNT